MEEKRDRRKEIQKRRERTQHKKQRPKKKKTICAFCTQQNRPLLLQSFASFASLFASFAVFNQNPNYC